MAVKIRLMRVGKKKQPTYRVVVADGRSPRDGRFIEIIGQYAPARSRRSARSTPRRRWRWLRKGAQPTEQVQKLLTEQGVWAQYESERSKPAVTKLSRRGYVTGKVRAAAKKAKAARGAAAEAAARCRRGGSGRRAPRPRPPPKRPPPRTPPAEDDRATEDADDRRPTTTSE